MSMTLRAVSLNDQPLSQPITARFDDNGGTIGRADHNTLALPDPERHISRRQAEIRGGAAGYIIRNIGSANPISVRGQPLSHGESAPLKHSDEVRIGGYLLEVIDEGDDTEATTVTHMRSASAAPQKRPAVAELDAPLSSGNPFAGLLGPASAAQAGPAPRLPDDFDPFAAAPRGAPAAVPAAESTGGTFADLIPCGEAASIDEAFGLQPGGRDALSDFMAGTPVPAPDAPAGAAVPTDPLALFGGTPPAVPSSAPTRPDHTPELHAAFKPPPVVAQKKSEPAAQVAAAPAAPVHAAQPPGLWAAFCEGAGVQLAPPQGLDPALMRLIGALLRNAVEGTLQLMAVRATTKQELHADMTIIQARNNNPLKFSPDAQSALEQMLQPRLRGFLSGPEAMADAMHDLVGHAIGSMAGTRAALEGVLARFAPQSLEAKLSAKPVVDSVLPMNRKAKLWELYLQHFDAIRDEAQDDFDTLFGKAFLAAYEQQLERLKRERPSEAA
jgi:FHA domain-containing protein